MRQIYLIGLLTIIFGLHSCIPGMIDRLPPQIHLALKNKDEVKIDSLCIVENDSHNSTSQCYKIADFDKEINDTWFPKTFNVYVYCSSGLILKSNEANRRTSDNYYDLTLTGKSLEIKRTGDSVILRFVSVFIILLLASLIFKALPSLIFIKPTNKNKYLILTTILNFGYWLIIIGFLLIVQPYDVFKTVLFLIIILTIIDSFVYGLIFRRNTSIIKLVSCILLTNLIFYGCGLQIMIMTTLFAL